MGRHDALRAGIALLLVGTIVTLFLRDRDAPDRNPDEPQAEDHSVSTATPDPSAPGPGVEPTDAVPEPPPGLEDLVCQRRTRTTDLRVLSFNTQRSYRAPGGPAAIAAEIRAVDPDIVLLQEVDRFMARSGGVDQADHLADAVGMDGSFSANLARGSGEYGTLILSRFPIRQEGRFPLAAPPGAEPRGLQWALLSVRGQPVRIYNTHLDAVRPSLRAQQARQVAETVSQERIPVILGGDLNAWPASQPVAMIGMTLTDTWAVGSGRPATGRGGRKIDYIFASSRLRPLRSQVLPSLVSDHHRLWADLRMRHPHRCGRGR